MSTLADLYFDIDDAGRELKKYLDKKTVDRIMLKLKIEILATLGYDGACDEKIKQLIEQFNDHSLDRYLMEGYNEN